MVSVFEWKIERNQLWGICMGHADVSDGTYIQTSPIAKIEVCEEGLNVYTHSGTHYYCKGKDIDLENLEKTKSSLVKKRIDTSFLDKVEESAKKYKEAYLKEVSGILEDEDLYLELIGITVKKAYFKHQGELIPLDCICHVGTFKDSFLIRGGGLVDVRYYDEWNGIEFYHVSDGIHYIYIKYRGTSSFRVTGVGDGLMFEANDAEVKKIKAEHCKEGLVTPDGVTGKSLLSNFDMESDEDLYEKHKELFEYLGSLQRLL